MSLFDRSVLDFLVFDWLGQDRSHEPILDLAETVATDHFLTHFKAADQDEPRLENGKVWTLPAVGDALTAYRDAGLFPLSFSEDLGGPGLPATICAAAGLFFAAANPSTAGFPMLTGANARLISRYGTPAQAKFFAKPLIEGAWFGTMCLSEPEAGSSLADIRTRAIEIGDDELGTRYALRGNKMWISAGDHEIADNIVHLVLAKIANADGAVGAGVEGISLFIVPKVLPDGTRNEVAVAGLNHKMGYRGIPNCLLNFGEDQGATGWRVGGAGQGLKIMFMMMNEARIAVGAGAAAIAARGLALSEEYAAERKQGRLGGGADTPQIPINQHPDVQRMLLQQRCYAQGAMALTLWAAKLVEEENPLADLITPVAKAWPSEFGCKSNDLAIQIHGGYGYTRDFDVEQLYRDQRLNPIHEGTNGIQALDLLLRKIMKDGGVGFTALMQDMSELIAKAKQEGDLAGFATRLADCQGRLVAATQAIGAQGAEAAMGVASAYQFAFSHFLIAHLWLSQLSAAKGEQREKLALTCRYFFEWELPQIGPALDLVSRGDKTLLDAAANAR